MWFEICYISTTILMEFVIFLKLTWAGKIQLGNSLYINSSAKHIKELWSPWSFIFCKGVIQSVYDIYKLNFRQTFLLNKMWPSLISVLDEMPRNVFKIVGKILSGNHGFHYNFICMKNDDVCRFFDEFEKLVLNCYILRRINYKLIGNLRR